MSYSNSVYDRLLTRTYYWHRKDQLLARTYAKVIEEIKEY